MTDLRDWAADQPLFGLNEAQRATGMKRPTLRETLSRAVKRGSLIRVERGKYTAHADPMIYASHIETPSYLSLWSGLRYYDVTTQQPARVQVITARNRKDLASVEFFRSRTLFGFGKRRYADFEIFVADPERLLLDCLARKAVPVEELSDLVEIVDIDTSVEYAAQLGTASVKKRLGYLLEAVRGESIQALQVDDRNYPRLDLTRPANGETDSKWRLEVNTNVA